MFIRKGLKDYRIIDAWKRSSLRFFNTNPIDSVINRGLGKKRGQNESDARRPAVIHRERLEQGKIKTFSISAYPGGGKYAEAVDLSLS